MPQERSAVLLQNGKGIEMKTEFNLVETRGRNGLNGALTRLADAPVFTRAEMPANRAPVKMGGRGRPRKYRLDLLQVGQFLDLSLNKRGQAATNVFRNRLATSVAHFEKRNPGTKFAIRVFKNDAVRVFRTA